MPSPELTRIIEDARSAESGDIQSMRAEIQHAPAYPKPADIAWRAVDSGGVEAEWNVPDDCAPGRVVVYCHGGGFALGDIRTWRPLCSHLARACRARVLSVGYRLAPEHPYPAALEDALAAYRFVLSSGADPTKLVLAGDSAGGGLAIATLVALREAGDPLPAAGVCLSPWFDLTLSNPAIDALADVDPMVTRPMLEEFRDAYLAGTDPRTPTVSPLHADLAGLPPLLVQVGRDEVLVGEAEAFAKRASAAGVDVTFEPWDDAFHVWHMFADELPEAREAIAGIGSYVAARLEDGSRRDPA